MKTQREETLIHFKSIEAESPQSSFLTIGQNYEFRGQSLSEELNRKVPSWVTSSSSKWGLKLCNLSSVSLEADSKYTRIYNPLRVLVEKCRIDSSQIAMNINLIAPFFYLKGKEVDAKSDEAQVAAVAEWYRYRTVACFVTGSSPVPLKIRCVGQRCTLNLSRAETSSRGCGVVVRRGGASSGVVHVT
ncbi:uncharacterized protein TNCV_280261 [Trichonephila clavipes]|nr:uncharacterized protein TNCV_280261 [Trichonephila clavipes]